MDGLTRYRDFFHSSLRDRLQTLSEDVVGEQFRTDAWRLIAFDRSRLSAPQTRSNKQRPAVGVPLTPLPAPCKHQPAGYPLHSLTAADYPVSTKPAGGLATRVLREQSSQLQYTAANVLQTLAEGHGHSEGRTKGTMIRPSPRKEKLEVEGTCQTTTMTDAHMFAQQNTRERYSSQTATSLFPGRFFSILSGP